jgi:hypothetical protein
MVLRHLAALALVTAAACSGEQDPGTPEEAASRGDQLLRKMSATLGGAQAFSFTSTESHERVRRNGEKEPYTLKRDVIVRRPNRLWFHTTGSDGRDVKVAYDGSTVTVLGDAHKVYAAFPAGPTLDETLDLASDRFDLRIAVADFLYGSPYDSFAGRDATGGWVRKIQVDGRECDEVAYTTPNVDFTLSITSAEPTLPCQVRITYKQEPGQPVTLLVFGNWNLQAEPGDAQFAASVPQGYERIPVIERIPKEELKANAAKAMGMAAKQ